MSDKPEVCSQRLPGGYLPMYRLKPTDKWIGLRRAGVLDLQPSASLAVEVAWKAVEIALFGNVCALCPTPEKSVTKDQREFYDRRAGEMSLSKFLAKRKLKTPLIVQNKAGKVLKKIGILK